MLPFVSGYIYSKINDYKIRACPLFGTIDMDMDIFRTFNAYLFVSMALSFFLYWEDYTIGF